MYQRGFKAWCEKYAATTRKDMGLADSAPLNSRSLAQHLDIAVCTPLDVPGLSDEHTNILLRNDGKTPSCWSAVTLVVGLKTLVILNSSHSPGRQASDLMHELAHKILGHEAHEMEISPDGLMLLKAYEKQQEDEADWLSATLLLPRQALVRIKQSRLSNTLAASEYGVSPRMLRYRMSMTGVERQFASRA